jgi:hypothetical protein
MTHDDVGFRVARGGFDAVDAAPASGLIAFSWGRTLSVIDTADTGFRRDFQHERTVSGVAFEPKGRRIAASTYGGAGSVYGSLVYVYGGSISVLRRWNSISGIGYWGSPHIQVKTTYGDVRLYAIDLVMEAGGNI